MNKIDFVLQFNNENALVNRLTALGLLERKDEDGKVINQNSRWGKCCSRIKEDVLTGTKFVTIRDSKEIADSLPPDSNPAFAVAWRSDVLVEREVEQFHYIHHNPVWDNTDPENPVLVKSGYREKVSDGMAMVETTEELPTYAVYTDETETTTRQQPVAVIA